MLRILDSIEYLATYGSGVSRQRGLASARRRIDGHLLAWQSTAQTVPMAHPDRDWMRRAIADVSNDALPALARVMRREVLGDEGADDGVSAVEPRTWWKSPDRDW